MPDSCQHTVHPILGLKYIGSDTERKHNTPPCSVGVAGAVSSEPVGSASVVIEGG